MADLKISQLNSIVTVVPATDVLPVVQGGTTLKITPKQILESGSPAVLASATITGALDAARLNVTGATIPANGVYLGSANNLSFSAASTLGMTLNATGLGISNGNVILSTSGKGIDFSATANSSGTMTSELLNDYEEGTFTPTISASSGAFTTVTTNSAKYTKIGRRVSMDLDISIINIGTASGLFFVTLPFSRSGDDTCGVFREISITGSMGSIYPSVGDPTRVVFNLFNNGTVIVNLYRLNGTYTYNV